MDIVEQAQESQLLTPKEVAVFMRVKEATVRSWLRSGKLEGLTVGFTWRSPPSALAALSNRKAGS